MNRFKLLDLFCKAGGCSMGYYQAGFDVTGVDIEPQPHYPFLFIQANALTFDLSGYDVIHASPPCPRYSSISKLHHVEMNHPDLLGIIRAKLQESGKPYIIENVMGAPFWHGVILCGSMFDLPIRRHRCFESNYLIMTPGPCKHTNQTYSIHGHHVWNNGNKRRIENANWKNGYYNRAEMVKREIGMKAMGITWEMNQEELSNAIPPAYTKWIGEQLLSIL